RHIGASDRTEAHHRHEHFRPGIGDGPRQHRVSGHPGEFAGGSIYAEGMAGGLDPPRAASRHPPQGGDASGPAEPVPRHLWKVPGAPEAALSAHDDASGCMFESGSVAAALVLCFNDSLATSGTCRVATIP